MDSGTEHSLPLWTQHFSPLRHGPPVFFPPPLSITLLPHPPYLISLPSNSRLKTASLCEQLDYTRSSSICNCFLWKLHKEHQYMYLFPMETTMGTWAHVSVIWHLILNRLLFCPVIICMHCSLWWRRTASVWSSVLFVSVFVISLLPSETQCS